MKKVKPPFEKYPGNKWLVEELARLKIDATIPFVHGVIRGALTNPAGVHPALAIARICDKKNPKDLKTEDLEMLLLALTFLWNNTACSFNMVRSLPEALTRDPFTRNDERAFNDEIIDLADGFLEGFCLATIPKKFRSEVCESFFLDIVSEAKLCLRWYDKPEEFEKEYEDPALRLEVLKGCLHMIEETMVLWHLHRTHASRDGDLFSGGIRKVRKKLNCNEGSRKNILLN